MSSIGYLKRQAWVKGEQKGWSSTVRMILGFILSSLVLSPAIVGLYWEMVLP
jgi:hypothetical protein